MARFQHLPAGTCTHRDKKGKNDEKKSADEDEDKEEEEDGEPEPVPTQPSDLADLSALAVESSIRLSEISETSP